MVYGGVSSLELHCLTFSFGMCRQTSTPPPPISKGKENINLNIVFLFQITLFVG